MTARRVLVLFAHPAFEKSRVNVHLPEAQREDYGRAADAAECSDGEGGRDA